MNTQAIKIIDEMIDKNSRMYSSEESYTEHGKGWVRGYNVALEEAKKRISSLPSLDIDSLQRYDCWMVNYDECDMKESDTGNFVYFKDVKKLLGR